MRLGLNDCDINLSIGLPGGGVTLLTIVLVILKVQDYIDWSWVWVFSPLWIGAAVIAFVLLVIVIVAVLAARKL